MLDGALFGGSEYSRAESSGAAPVPGFQQGLAQELFASQQQQTGDNPLLMLGVIPGVPVNPELPEPPGSGRAGQGHEKQPLPPSTMLGRQAAARREPVLLQMLGGNMMQQQAQAGFQLTGQDVSLQGSPQLPQWPPLPLQQQHILQQQRLLQHQMPQQFLRQQQQQQQAGFAFGQDFNDGSGSTSSMNSAQVPQLQARPANAGLLRMPLRDCGSSPVGGRVARRGRSHSMGSTPRTGNQNRLAQPAQRDAEGISGHSFPSMPSLPAGSPRQWDQRAGLMGPSRAALPSPSPSPSPDRVLRLGQALHRTIFAPPKDGAEGAPSNVAMELGLMSQQLSGGMLQDFLNPFQSHANTPWDPAVDPSTSIEGPLMHQPVQQLDTEPGEHAVLQQLVTALLCVQVDHHAMPSWLCMQGLT